MKVLRPHTMLAVTAAFVLIAGLIALSQSERETTRTARDAPAGIAVSTGSTSASAREESSAVAKGATLEGARTETVSANGHEPATTVSPFATGEMRIEISPACAVRTQQVTVTIHTVPLADVAHAASFADGNHHNLYGLGQADVSGQYLWVFLVPPDAAFGEAKVLVGARHPEKGGGSGLQVFRVGKAGECR